MRRFILCVFPEQCHGVVVAPPFPHAERLPIASRIPRVVQRPDERHARSQSESARLGARRSPPHGHAAVLLAPPQARRRNAIAEENRARDQVSHVVATTPLVRGFHGERQDEGDVGTRQLSWHDECSDATQKGRCFC